MNSFSASPLLCAFSKAVSKEKSALVEELWDGPKAALIALLKQATDKNILIITSDKSENRLAHNLDYFGLNHFLEFPAWETLPGEEIPPSPDIVGRRFEILYGLLTKPGPHVLLCSLQACLQKLPPKAVLKPNCNLWTVGEEIPFDALDPDPSCTERLQAVPPGDEPDLMASPGQLRSEVTSDGTGAHHRDPHGGLTFPSLKGHRCP